MMWENRHSQLDWESPNAKRFPISRE